MKSTNLEIYEIICGGKGFIQRQRTNTLKLKLTLKFDEKPREAILKVWQRRQLCQHGFRGPSKKIHALNF